LVAASSMKNSLSLYREDKIWEQKSPGTGAHPGFVTEPVALAWTLGLDLADQVQRGLQRGSTFFPLGGANFTGMSGDVLGGLDLAQQVLGVTADAFGGDFHGLDHAVRVDDVGAAVGQAFVFAQDFEVAADRQGRVADHRVLILPIVSDESCHALWVK